MKEGYDHVRGCPIITIILVIIDIEFRKLLAYVRRIHEVLNEPLTDLTQLFKHNITEIVSFAICLQVGSAR